MKVICISDDFIFHHHAVLPSIGEILTAHQSSWRDDCYIISQYLFTKNGKRQNFRKKNFIPLSDIDETELIKERESEAVKK